jgi:hypothetical protein
MTMCPSKQLPEQEPVSGAEAAPDQSGKSGSREPSASRETEQSRGEEQQAEQPPLDRTEFYLRGPTAFCA